MNIASECKKLTSTVLTSQHFMNSITYNLGSVLTKQPT